MANLEKHKRNLVDEFLGDDQAGEPVQLRSVLVTGAHGKTAGSRHSRPTISNGQAAKPDPALIREAAPPKLEQRTSQASSPEHLRKLQRLPNLRAPYMQPGRRAG